MPTPAQALLLEAALADGDAARHAYVAWRAVADFHGQLDDGSFRLLPRLYKSLLNAGVVDAETPRLRGIHRLSWATGRLLGRLLADVARALAERGIDMLVLKGGALGNLYYADPGERPMSDVDVLVRPADTLAAIRVLAELGWTPDRPLPDGAWPPSPRTPNPAERPVGHGFSLGRPNDPAARGLGLDLHWFAVPQSLQPGVDDGFWARAVPLEVGGVKTRTLSAEDHLLHALAHGVMWNVVPSIRWVADAVLIAKSRPLDWDIVIAEARRRGVVQPVRETLTWLAAAFDFPVPEAVLMRLSALRVGPIDRWRYAFAMHAWSDRETLMHFGFDVFRYAEGRPLTSVPTTISRYLAHRWGTTNPLKIAMRVLERRLRGT